MSKFALPPALLVMFLLGFTFGYFAGAVIQSLTFKNNLQKTYIYLEKQK